METFMAYIYNMWRLYIWQWNKLFEFCWTDTIIITREELKRKFLLDIHYILLLNLKDFWWKYMAVLPPWWQITRCLGISRSSSEYFLTFLTVWSDINTANIWELQLEWQYVAKNKYNYLFGNCLFWHIGYTIVIQMILKIRWIEEYASLPLQLTRKEQILQNPSLYCQALVSHFFCPSLLEASSFILPPLGQSIIALWILFIEGLTHALFANQKL